MIKWLFIFAIPSMVLAGFIPTPESHCTPLDLRNETLGKVRDQKDIAWCYAFTAADMLAHTFNLSRVPISAADVAIGYNESGIGRFARWLSANFISRRDQVALMSAHQTGFTKVALIKAMRSGWCSEEIFPSEYWIKMTRTENGWIPSSVPLQEAMIDIAKLHKNRRHLTPENLPYYFAFNNVDEKSFIDLLQYKRVAGFYSALRSTVCLNEREDLAYRWKVKMVFRNRRIFRRISEQLELGRLVGMDYDSRILKDRTHRGLSVAELHTSSLVGRRWNDDAGSCEYLIRNSYGESCDHRYDPTYDCEEGNIWLSERLIYPSLTSIVYMLSGT